MARKTRYFVFTRVNPTKRDYENLVKTCEAINAHMGYKTVHSNDKVRLVGFICLRGSRTFTRKICRLFPNFNLTRMKGPMDWNGIDLVYDVVINEHPFAGIRRNLFS